MSGSSHALLQDQQASVTELQPAGADALLHVPAPRDAVSVIKMIACDFCLTATRGLSDVWRSFVSADNIRGGLMAAGASALNMKLTGRTLYANRTNFLSADTWDLVEVRSCRKRQCQQKYCNRSCISLCQHYYTRKYQRDLS